MSAKVHGDAGIANLSEPAKQLLVDGFLPLAEDGVVTAPMRKVAKAARMAFKTFISAREELCDRGIVVRRVGSYRNAGDKYELTGIGLGLFGQLRGLARPDETGTLRCTIDHGCRLWDCSTPGNVVVIADHVLVVTAEASGWPLVSEWRKKLLKRLRGQCLAAHKRGWQIRGRWAMTIVRRLPEARPISSQLENPELDIVRWAGLAKKPLSVEGLCCFTQVEPTLLPRITLILTTVG